MFERRQTLELRPVTVLLGRNNSGKSALARLPVFLETGLRTDSEAPLEPEAVDFDIADAFTDLIYGQRPHGKVTFGLRLDSAERGLLEIEASVQNIDEFRLQVVSDFQVRMPNQGADFALTWNIDNPTRPTWSYSGPESLASTIGDPVFRGLLPRPRSTVPLSESKPWLRRLSLASREYPTIRYVGPFRDRPQRYYRLPSRAPGAVGVVGENAPHILADDVIRGNSGLLTAVNDYLRRELPGWSLDVTPNTNLFSLVLASATDPAIRVNLADTGTELAQVLPILVQRTMDAIRSPGEEVLEVVEQPELHLHPAAHAALADLYLSGAQNGRCRFLIETHSETFVLRLRRRVAQGDVSPDMIALYFVEHDGTSATLRRIDLDELGNVANWPDGVFSEDYVEARALVAAQIERT
ncbi:AAA domain [Frankia sp. AiPs1]|uniref:AAA family ATPase n=1 Tax=Frankia sp. AiPa1 TaxID=573492 RepID=UPI00202B2186|nr:DUF3696 domain-containing protein [Frankia sp. AiPa1]MCL9758526.1 DUF3696 domain-containing protein [Frankia sp. AiPa1]